MSIYSRAIRHINMRDVAKNHQKKLIEKKIKEENEIEEKKIIDLIMEEEKYDWRKELLNKKKS